VQLADQFALDHDYISHHTDGIEAALLSARADVAVGDVVARLGVAAEDLARFCQWFIDTPKAMTLFSMGVNQSGQGTDKVNAILNVHLATGRIGKVGAGPFSLTGQPNAMGGREVGGLSNMLAAHMDIQNPTHRSLVQTFWQSPTIVTEQGLKAVELFDAVAAGKIKAIWIMATNPIVSLPNADRVKQALADCPLVIVSEVMADTDCTRVADVLLPAMGWSEKDGTVTNSERLISRQRAVLPAAGEARPDWWALAQVAQKMGFAGFDYSHPHAVFIEHAALSAYQNSDDQVRRDFNLAGLAQLSFEEYQNLVPAQWGSKRFFAEGDFFTPNRRARIVPVSLQATGHQPSSDYPFILNTGRLRDQWHTMSRTGLTARLTRHTSEPYAELHPADAAQLAVQNGDILSIKSAWGSAFARVLVNDGQQRGMTFVPIHWNGVNSANSRIGAVVNPVVDPFSGQPENKFTPVALCKAEFAQYGFVLSAEPLPLLTDDGYAVNVRLGNGWRQEFAVNTLLEPLAFSDMPASLDYQDTAQGIHRLAWLDQNRLSRVVMVAHSANRLPPRGWMDEQLGQLIDASTRRSLLSGVAADPTADIGEIVCSCFVVGKNIICRAIQAQNLTTVAAVGQCLKAGTNCGSCQSEIAKLIAQIGSTAVPKAAAISLAQTVLGE
jgi:assimilatory nitrate reductase catalytic subunit